MSQEQTINLNAGTVLAITASEQKIWINLLSCFTQKTLNASPVDGQWSAAQVATHVALSVHSLIQTVSSPGSSTEQNPQEKIISLKNIFLNFEKKMTSPAFIEPEKKTYDKDELLDFFSKSCHAFNHAFGKYELNLVHQHLVLGEISGMEMLYFNLFHTQRHLFQLTNILKATLSTE